VAALGYFSAVVLADTEADYGRSAAMLSAALAWPPLEVNGRGRKNTRAAGGREAEASTAAAALSGSPAALRKLERLNGGDLEVYEAALALHREQAVRLGLSGTPRGYAALFRLGGGGGAGDGGAAGPAGALGPVRRGRSGFGGHTGACAGRGSMSLARCRTLLLGAPACGALSHKNGACFLHDTGDRSFWEGESPGNVYQEKGG